MGKIRTRIIGNEETEKKQKEEQKERAKRKKMEKILAENPDLEASEETDAAPADAKATQAKALETKTKKKTRVRGKNYTAAKKKLDLDKVYALDEAVEALKKAAFAKFAESVELHLNLLSESLKGEVELPHATGKTVRVAIVDDKVIAKLEEGIIDFDVLITHPSFMPKIAKFARTLGPKGLMPNPKSGTVSPNPEEVAKKFAGGTIRWKSESKAPLIHQMVAKLPSETKEIVENVIVFMRSVGKKNIKAAFIKSTMSPALKINLETIE